MALGGILAGGAAQAEEQPFRPFVFTVTTTQVPGSERWSVHYDAGYAERTATPFGYGGVEQRVGVQGALGSGFTVLGQLGLGLDTGNGQSTSIMQEAEILKDLLGPSRGLQLATGLGVRREWQGTTALLGRVSLGHVFAGSSLFGNLRFERPLAEGRDGVDLITSIGWLFRVGSALHLGLETIGEDFEGFWEAEEAEGGAKLFVGPSAHLTSANRRLYASLCGGPIFYATRSGRTSGAPRPLGGSGSGNGYTLRLSVGYGF